MQLIVTGEEHKNMKVKDLRIVEAEFGMGCAGTQIHSMTVETDPIHCPGLSLGLFDEKEANDVLSGGPDEVICFSIINGEDNWRCPYMLYQGFIGKQLVVYCRVCEKRNK